MKKYNILVTGVGAIIGYGIIASLRKSKYDCNIVGMDIFDDASGQVWCDNFVKAIPASSEDYILFLKGIIDKYDIDLVFFGTEQEIKKCYDCKNQLEEYYNKLVINSDSAILLAEDKWDTMNFLMENGLNSIPSSISADFSQACEDFGLPLLMKPRKSYASKGIMLVNTQEEFDNWKAEYFNQFMVQKYIGDDEHEYTASTFAFGDGTCIKPIVMRRKLSKAGATDKAVVEKICEIEEEINHIVKVLKPLGPTNFQFRFHEGNYYLLEINPRISSSTSIRTSFGYNEAEMCIEYFLEKKQISNRIIRTGKAFRYIAEEIIYDSNNI